MGSGDCADDSVFRLFLHLLLQVSARFVDESGVLDTALMTGVRQGIAGEEIQFASLREEVDGHLGGVALDLR